MILSRVAHRKLFSERSTKAGEQPIRIVLHRPLGCLTLFNKIADDFDNHIFGKSVKMELDRVQGPVAFPIVIQTDLNGLILLINAVGKEILNSGILGKGNVRADVKEKSALETKRSRMTAVVAIL